MRQVAANTLFYMEERDGSLWRVQLPDGKKERIPWTFQGLDPFEWSVSTDGKELYWSEHRTQGKLVMIENPFK
jgi:hypothetical protein